jgi:hypothetical protein
MSARTLNATVPLRTLTGLANAFRRVAREIDQLHGPTDTGTNSN